MSMTLDEMKLAVCEKLPELIRIVVVTPSTIGMSQHDKYKIAQWKEYVRGVNWPTEGLQVCHEAEKLLNVAQRTIYNGWLTDYTASKAGIEAWTHHATYEQRLEALCRVWFPEKFK